MNMSVLAENLSVNLTTVVVTLFLLFLVQYHWNRRKLYYFAWKCEGPFAWPFIGNAFSWRGGTVAVVETMQRFNKEYDSSIRFWMGSILVYLVQSPDEIAAILTNPKCLKKNYVYDMLRPGVGEGLLTSAVNKWKLHRKSLNPTFSQKILDSYVEIFQEQAAIFNETLKKYVGKGEFDILHPMNVYTLDVVCETAMGIKLHDRDMESRVIYCLESGKEIVVHRVFKLWLQFDFIFNMTSLSTKYNSLSKEVREFTRKVVKEKRSELVNTKNKLKDEHDNTNSKRKSFLEHVLELTDKETFSDEDCIDEVTTFMMAGSDSSATINSFTLVCLAMYPHVQAKVFEELDEIFGNSSLRERPVTLEDLPKLKYLERVIKESMRIFSPLVFIGREPAEDIDLKSKILPAGVSVMIPLFSIHRDERYWKDPLNFDPDRFLPEEISKRHPFCYLPFSIGPRNCIGFQFGLMSLKVTLASILRAYKFKTSYKKIEDIKVGWHITSRPRDGHKLQIMYRNNQTGIKI